MKRRTLWILLAVLVIAAILLFVLLGQGGKGESKTAPETETAESEPVDPELPLDDTPLATVSPSSEESTDSSEPTEEQPAQELEPSGTDARSEQSNPEQPYEGGLDENELPIIP